MGLFPFSDMLFFFLSILYLFSSISDDYSDDTFSSGVHLIFKYDGGKPDSVDVYLDGTYLGSSDSNELYVDDLYVGDMRVVFYINGKRYVNYFDISWSDLDYKTIIFELNNSRLYQYDLIDKDSYIDYIEAVELNNPTLRHEAINASRMCPSGDDECRVVHIFHYFINKYKYINDPGNGEYIQSPEETRQYGGGDCEDLSILLASLLENIGIDTYMVLTDNHVYLLACGLDPEIISYYDSSLFNLTDYVGNYTTNIVLGPGEVYYYGGAINSIDLYLHLIGYAKSNGTIYLLRFSSVDDYFYFRDGDYYDVSNDIYDIGKDFDFDIFVPAKGGIAFWNNENDTKEFDLSMLSYYSVIVGEDSTPYVNRYYIDNKVCIPLDPSIATFNYVGKEMISPYEDKIAVNILSGEAQYLD